MNQTMKLLLPFVQIFTGILAAIVFIQRILNGEQLGSIFYALLVSGVAFMLGSKGIDALRQKKRKP